MFKIVSNTFFGYKINDLTNPLYSILFNANSVNPQPQTNSQVLNNLKSLQSHCYGILSQTLTSPGIQNSPLKNNSWWANEASWQNTWLDVDATSLANLVAQNYFGYHISDTNNPLFAILFTNQQDSQVAKSKQAIFASLIALRASACDIVGQNINNPITPISSIDKLKDNSWLKIQLTKQKSYLITSLTNGISKFYSVFNAAFLGANFNDESFANAEDVLLFFNHDEEGNLTLATNPLEISKTFVNNLNIKLKQNPHFCLPNMNQSLARAVDYHYINNWVNSLSTNIHGNVILKGDLENFYIYQKSQPNVTTINSNIILVNNNHQKLILAISIPLSLIGGTIGIIFIKKASNLIKTKKYKKNL